MHPWQVPLHPEPPVRLLPGRMGTTSTYGLKNAEERAILFIGAGVEVYEGMVVGETHKTDRFSGQYLQEKTSYQYACIQQRY